MARSSRGIIPPIDLDRRSRAPLFRQIERGLRDAIQSGRLPAGTRIPSTRVLANYFEVSRTTVLLAFDQLIASGLLVATPGGGTYVADAASQTPAAALPEEGNRPARWASDRGAAVLGDDARRQSDTVRPFSLAQAATREFPFDAWARAQAEARRVLTAEGVAPLDPAGHPRLRSAAARFLQVARRVPCEPDQIVIVANIQEALHLVGTLLMDRGDAFWHSDPGHPAHRSILEGLGGRPVAVGVDEEGLDVEAGRRAAPEARVAVVSPSGEFPLARRTSPARRSDLLRWAREADAFVVEDDWDPASFLFGRPSPSMAGQDVDGRVIYVAGLARMLATVLHMAIMVVPRYLVGPLVDVRRRQQLLGVLGGQPPVLDQLALADFLARGHLEHMARSRGDRYRARHRVLLHALERELDGRVQVDPADELSYAVVRLPEDWDDRDVARRLAMEGVETLPLSGFSGDRGWQGLVVGSAAFAEEALEAGAAAMGRVFAAL